MKSETGSDTPRAMKSRVNDPERELTGLRSVHPIRGVGLSMEIWARSCASEDPIAVAASGPMWALQCEFPAVPWALMALPFADALVIPERSWRASRGNFREWDEAMGSLFEQPRWLVVQGDEEGGTLGDTAREILTRYQRLAPRTNSASSTPEFRKVLSGHQALHDLSVPHIRTLYDHALDVWQWILRLSPNAGLSLQLAGLFLDIGRLVNRPDPRPERPGSEAHAPCADAGSALAAQVLEACGIDTTSVAEVARLIRQRELWQPPNRDASAALLADADALSFFSLHSPGFADAYGPEGTQRKVRHTLGRMSSDAVRRLVNIRLREDVRRCLADAAHAESHSTLEQIPSLEPAPAQTPNAAELS